VIIKAIFKYKDGTNFVYSEDIPWRTTEPEAIEYLWEYESFADRNIFPQPCTELVGVEFIEATP
jgi:hypothetical protein